MKFLYTFMITITVLLPQLSASEMMDFVQRTDIQYTTLGQRVNS